MTKKPGCDKKRITSRSGKKRCVKKSGKDNKSGKDEKSGKDKKAGKAKKAGTCRKNGKVTKKPQRKAAPHIYLTDT